MRTRGSSGWIFLVACIVAAQGGQAFAAPAPTFTITATNVTFPSQKSGSASQYTITSLNGYAGNLLVGCAFAGGAMVSKIPECGGFTAALHPIAAGQTITGTLNFAPYGTPMPVALSGRRHSHLPLGGLAIASLLLFGRRLRGGARWLALCLLGVISIAGVTACGGNGLSGTFPFTVTATDVKTQASVATPITVTVP
jgi:hypothetical protein